MLAGLTNRMIAFARGLFPAPDPDADLEAPGEELVKLSKRQQREHLARLRQQDRETRGGER